MEILVDKYFTFEAPHDIIWITDNSRYQDIPVISANAVILMPFVSDRGRDNVFSLFRGSRDLARAIREYGYKNFRRHGQPYYQFLKVLESGGWAIGMRLTADDATYANVVIVAKVKADTSGNKIHVKLATKTISQLKSLDTVEAELKVAPGSDEYKEFPLFVAVSKGRGSYGNNFSIRMSIDKLENSISDYRNYGFEVLTWDKGSSEASEAITACLHADARTNGLSTYIENVIDRYNEDLRVFVNEDVILELMAHIKTVTDNVPGTSPEKTEILVEPTVSAEKPTHVVYEPDTSPVDLTTAKGIPLAGGSDGNWEGKKFGFSGDGVYPGLEQKFADFYTGKINNNVFNVLKVGPNAILDANFPMAVKNAMVALITNRIDIHAFFDCNIQATAQKVADWEKTFTCTNWNATLHSQHMKVVDDAFGKEITVTTPYVLSYKLPEHYLNWGSHIPMAGHEKGRLAGVIENSIYPKVNTLVEKDLIYKARANYIEEGEGYDLFGTQITRYMYKSKIMHTHNALMLSEMAKLILKLVRLYRFEFTEPEDLDRFVRMGNETLASYKDKVNYLEYTVTQTPYQKTRGILKDLLRVRFKDIVTHNQVEIEILGNNSEE